MWIAHLFLESWRWDVLLAMLPWAAAGLGEAESGHKAAPDDGNPTSSVLDLGRHVTLRDQTSQ